MHTFVRLRLLVTKGCIAGNFQYSTILQLNLDTLLTTLKTVIQVHAPERQRVQTRNSERNNQRGELQTIPDPPLR